MKRFAGFLLDALHFRPLHLADGAALHANQMVVMRALVLDFKFGQAVGRRDAFHEAAFFEHF